MLEPGDHDLVPGPDVRAAPAWATRLIASVAPRTNTISSLRGGVQEPAALLARVLVGVGRPRRELVRAAMDVRVLVPIEVLEAIDHGLRLLRRRAVVQPHQRAAVHASASTGNSRRSAYDVEPGVRRQRPEPERGVATRSSAAERSPDGQPPRGSSASRRTDPASHPLGASGEPQFGERHRIAAQREHAPPLDGGSGAGPDGSGCGPAAGMTTAPGRLASGATR